jgi:hypothetical protein
MGTRSFGKQRRSAPGRGTETDGETWELSKSQVRELRRRVRDLEDRTRYLLVSVFTPRMVLYYNVSNDTFGMNNPSLGTLFKRRTAAVAIQRLLRTGIQVIKCQADRQDRVVKSSLPRLRRSARLLPVGRGGGASRAGHA